MSSASDRRKSGGDGDGGGANWMDTYGDLVTLLLTFFVLLFSFSNIDAAKWQALVGSFTGVSVMSNTPLSPDVVVQNPIEKFGPQSPAAKNAAKDSADEASDDPLSVAEDKLMQLYELMGSFAAENDIDADIVLIRDEYTVRMVFNDLVFFDTAEAT
ncbi:MAG: hypothetical protein LBH28_01330, partial [Oscillospiraceae bacterium]|nr:hypothetical protein [Oscillospiraceae bacterium]